MAVKTSTRTKKATLAALNLAVARNLLELSGPSILKLAKDKARWELTRKLLLRISSAKEHGTDRKAKKAS
jgi:hypothetical protein